MIFDNDNYSLYVGHESEFTQTPFRLSNYFSALLKSDSKLKKVYFKKDKFDFVNYFGNKFFTLTTKNEDSSHLFAKSRSNLEDFFETGNNSYLDGFFIIHSSQRMARKIRQEYFRK
jgi:hypothetical protein